MLTIPLKVRYNNIYRQFRIKILHCFDKNEKSCKKGRKKLKKVIALTAAGMLLISGCSLQSSGPVAAVVGGEKINQSEVKFYQDTFGSMLDTSEGVTQGAIEYAIDDRIVLELSDKLDLELSEDEEDSVKSTVIRFRQSRGGLNAYKQYVKANGLSEDFVEDVFKAMALREKLKNEDQFDVTDEEMQQYFKDNYFRAKHILITTKDPQTGEEYDDAKKQEAKTKAEDILKRAQAGENFDTLMNENTEDPGSQSQPNGYVFTYGEMVPEFEDAVKNSEIGEITMCESSYGYHIIQRLALDETQEIFDEGYNSAKNTIERKLQDEKFSSKIREMAQSNNIKFEEKDKNKEKVIEELTSATPYPTPEPSSSM